MLHFPSLLCTPEVALIVPNPNEHSTTSILNVPGILVDSKDFSFSDLGFSNCRVSTLQLQMNV